MYVFSCKRYTKFKLPASFVVFFVLLIIFSGCDKKSRDVKMAALEGLSEPPVISIYVQEGAIIDLDKDVCSVIIAVWKNGRVIWSNNAFDGGPPYYESRIKTQKIQDFLKMLDQKKVFSSSQSFISNLGPDADFTSLVIRDDANRLWMCSWHEQFENNPNLVATDSGISSLDQFGGLSRQEVLDKQSEAYKEFRRNWNIIREEAKKLIPDDGQIIEDAKFEIRRL